MPITLFYGSLEIKQKYVQPTKLIQNKIKLFAKNMFLHKKNYTQTQKIFATRLFCFDNKITFDLTFSTENTTTNNCESNSNLDHK